MNEKLIFKEQRLNGGVSLYYCNQEKFKTNLINLNIVTPLKDSANTTRTALLPGVLYRGSNLYPGRQEIVKKLDSLYGASLNLSVLKRGIYQILSFKLEIVKDQYLASARNIMKEGIELLYQLVFQPLLPDNHFRTDYVEQEKNILAAEIGDLVNDKYNYALERCIQEMCHNEPFSIYKLGSIKHLPEINYKNLTDHYQQLFGRSSLVLMIMGEVTEQGSLALINKKFDVKCREKLDYNQGREYEVENIDEVRETRPVKQARMTLGYRTGITRSDDLYFPLLVYNGLLGGFPHSRLFRVLREEYNLVYYIQSRLESSYGLQFINCGIEEQNYKKVRRIISEQKNDIISGNIEQKEIEWTIKGLVSRYRSSADSNKGLIAQQLLGYVNNINQSLDHIIRKIQNVELEDIKKVAEMVQLDTIYLLHNGGSDRHE